MKLVAVEIELNETEDIVFEIFENGISTETEHYNPEDSDRYIIHDLSINYNVPKEDITIKRIERPLVVNPKHYYFKLDEYGKITDVFTSDYAGMCCSDICPLRKRTWEQNFKLYRETMYILKKARTPDDFTYYPLYRHLGQDEEDYIFESKEDALREYESQLGTEIFCINHDC